MAFAKGRFRPVDPFAAWLRAAAAPEVIEIVPIDVRVALALTGLPASLPNDPADRLIVATARACAAARHARRRDPALARGAALEALARAS